eukprot:scaffold28716_cov107-Isochrysis_galbana.AAC.2
MAAVMRNCKRAFRQPSGLRLASEMHGWPGTAGRVRAGRMGAQPHGTTSRYQGIGPCSLVNASCEL